MTATIIDGKTFAAGLRTRIADGVVAYQAEAGRVPGLAVILVGEDPASAVYVRNKAKQTIEVGMHSVEHKLPADTMQADLIALVNTLNADCTQNNPTARALLKRFNGLHPAFNAAHIHFFLKDGRRHYLCTDLRRTKADAYQDQRNFYEIYRP